MGTAGQGRRVDGALLFFGGGSSRRAFASSRQYNTSSNLSPPSTPPPPPLPTSQAEIADLKQQVENLTARLNAAEGGGEAAG